MAAHSATLPRQPTPNIKIAEERIKEAGWGSSNLGLHNVVKEAWAAADRVQGCGVVATPLVPSSWAAQQAGIGRMMLKLENQQTTGSFKLRGAVNKVFSLTDDELQHGLIACSSGNFAAALLHACAALQQKSPDRAPVRPQIYLGASAAPSKVRALREAGADVVMHGHDVVEAEVEARRAAEARGATYCSPYNDLKVAGGAGTCALELLAELRPPGGNLAVFIPVGGGGLCSGMAAVLKSADADITVVGCQPEASDVMRASVAAGRIVDQSSCETLSDGSAGGIEPGSLTLEPCRRFVDDWVTVSEPEIAAAMLDVRDQHDGLLLEGSAAMAVACAIKYGRERKHEAQELQHMTGVVICCGGNASESAFRTAERLVSDLQH